MDSAGRPEREEGGSGEGTKKAGPSGCFRHENTHRKAHPAVLIPPYIVPGLLFHNTLNFRAGSQRCQTFSRRLYKIRIHIECSSRGGHGSGVIAGKATAGAAAGPAGAAQSRAGCVAGGRAPGIHSRRSGTGFRWPEPRWRSWDIRGSRNRHGGRFSRLGLYCTVNAGGKTGNALREHPLEIFRTIYSSVAITRRGERCIFHNRFGVRMKRG